MVSESRCWKLEHPMSHDWLLSFGFLYELEDQNWEARDLCRYSEGWCRGTDGIPGIGAFPLYSGVGKPETGGTR